MFMSYRVGEMRLCDGIGASNLIQEYGLVNGPRLNKASDLHAVVWTGKMSATELSTINGYLSYFFF